MRQFYTIAITAIVTAAISVWGTSVIVAQKNLAGASYSTVDVMQLTLAAKNLPVESFDAY